MKRLWVDGRVVLRSLSSSSSPLLSQKSITVTSRPFSSSLSSSGLSSSSASSLSSSSLLQSERELVKVSQFPTPSLSPLIASPFSTSSPTSLSGSSSSLSPVKPSHLGGEQQQQQFQFFDGVVPQSKIEDIGALRVQFEAFWKGLFYLCDDASSGRDSHLEFQEVFQESFSEIFSFTPSSLGEEKRRYDPEEVVKMLRELSQKCDSLLDDMHFTLISISTPPHKAARTWVSLCHAFNKTAQCVVSDVRKGEITKFTDRWGGVLESLKEVDDVMESGMDIEESDKEMITQALIPILNVWAVYVPLVARKIEFSNTQLEMLQILLSLSRAFLKEKNAVVEVMPLYACALANSGRKKEVCQFMDDYVSEMNKIDTSLGDDDWAWYLQSLDVRASTFLDVSVGLAREHQEDSRKLREQGQKYLKRAATSGLEYLSDPARREHRDLSELLLSVLHRLTLDNTGNTMSGLLGEDGGVSGKVQWGEDKKRQLEELGEMWRKLQLYSTIDDDLMAQIQLGKTTLSISALMMTMQEALVAHDTFEKSEEADWYQSIKTHVDELEGKETGLILSCFDPQLLIVFSTLLFKFHQKFDDLQVAKLGVDICTKGVRQIFCWPSDFTGLETLPRAQQTEQLAQQFPVFRSKVWGEFMMNLPVPSGKKQLDPLALLLSPPSSSSSPSSLEEEDENFKCDVLELAAFSWDIEAREEGGMERGPGEEAEEGEEDERVQIDEMRLGLLHRLAGRKGVQGKWEEAASYSGYAYQVGRSLDENQMKLTHVTVPTFLTYALSLAKLRVTQMDKSVITEALETGQKFEQTIEQARGHVEDDEKANQVLSEVKVRMKLLRKALKDMEGEGR